MVAPDRPLHLDALVASAAYKSAERAEAENPLAAIDELPLGEIHRSGKARGIWQASQLHLEQVGPIYWNHYVRRHEISTWADSKQKGHWRGNRDEIPMGSGPQKGFSFYQPLINVKRAIAWCVGEEEALRVLLESEIISLGRNGRAGFGRVNKIDITPCSENENEFWRRRALPLDLQEYKLPGHYKGTANCRAPYWDRSTWEQAWEYEVETPAASAELMASTAGSLGL